MAAALPPWPYPRWIAHRGAGTRAPENTLAAFRLGRELGFRMFECDARLSADGVPFLLHDNTLDRTTSGRGAAGRKPWAELAGLDAGAWHSAAHAGEALPRLEQILHFCLEHALLLNVEIKPTPGTEARTTAVVAGMVLALWPRTAVPPLLSSFSAQALHAARQTAPELPRALVFEAPPADWLEQTQRLQCVAVACKHTRWTESRVQEATTAGLRTLAWTVNTPRAAQRLIAWGVDSLFTDNPLLLREPA